jgi:UDP-N-acetylglucosamine transferase subunit ALG13
VPLIQKFLSVGFKVIIAAGGDQKILLQSVFPQLELVEIKGYSVKYGSTKWKTVFKIFFQIPKILIAINSEKKWLKRFVTEKHLDVIVSDNRFGLHHKSIVSVFITHQLGIKTSLGKFADKIAQQINYYFINQFDYCWVPDTATDIHLAGELSHPLAKPAIPVLYTGLLSAIKKEPLHVTNPLLLLLSGPEPQRTILENMLLQQLNQQAHPAILVRGLPSATTTLPARKGLTVYNYLSGQQLQQVINASAIIVSRAGYSTLMDLLPLGKKCIVIPTPGQAEQEYLAHWLSQQGYVCSCPQQDFRLPALLQKAAWLQVPDIFLTGNKNSADEAISNLVAALDARQRKA